MGSRRKDSSILTTLNQMYPPISSSCTAARAVVQRGLGLGSARLQARRGSDRARCHAGTAAFIYSIYPGSR